MSAEIKWYNLLFSAARMAEHVEAVGRCRHRQLLNTNRAFLLLTLLQQ
jgi:hypothetical protein